MLIEESADMISTTNNDEPCNNQTDLDHINNHYCIGISFSDHSDANITISDIADGEQ